MTLSARWLLVVVGVLSVPCGGGGASTVADPTAGAVAVRGSDAALDPAPATTPALTPTPTTTPTPTPDGRTLTIVSGETDGPVSGARVTVDGATFTSELDGQVRLPRRPAEMAPIDIVAAGYLDRLTVFRIQETRLSLWPRTSATGLTDFETMCLVYTAVRWDGEGPLLQISPIGADSLRQRYSRAPVQVFYSAGFEGAHPVAIATQAAAVAELNEALGEGLTYLPPRFAAVPASEPGELHVVLTIDPTHPSCALGFAGTGEPPPAGPAGGTVRLNYCSAEYARNRRIALHELGHTFGLRHTDDANDLMIPGGGMRAFSPKERLVIRLMLQRRPGNVFPDTDACRWNPEWCTD